MAITILGELSADIWPNASAIYEAQDLPNIEVKMHVGLNMDHGNTFQTAIPDVVDFFCWYYWVNL